MISSDLATRLRRLTPVIMTITGVIFIMIGILVNYLKIRQNTTLNSVGLEKTASGAGESRVKTIIVDISGAVEQPGVYTIPYDSRIANVLITAGGLAPKADRKYVSRYINLAQRVSDGMKIYIPFEDDSLTPISNQFGSININTASVNDLDSLPGVGIATANKIITGRPYQNISELTSRGVISKSIFDKIKDKISIN